MGFKVKFEGMVAAIKVRATSARELARNSASICYVKFEKNSAYVYGIVGEKVVYIKVSIEELLARLCETVTELTSNAKARLSVTKDAIQLKMIKASELAKRT